MNSKTKFGKLCKIAANGIVTNNPTFRLVLGMCPTLAVTVTMMSGMAMGLATMFVLICSNVAISLLRKIIPDKVRMPAYIVIVATFVTIVDMVMYKFLPDLHETLGVFIALIVVNCIILARAEAFASQNPVLDSAVDGLGMGLGFTVSLTLLGFLRELLGLGSVLGTKIWDSPIAIFSQPAGAFFTLGIMMAIFNFIFNAYTAKREEKLRGEPTLRKEPKTAEKTIDSAGSDCGISGNQAADNGVNRDNKKNAIKVEAE